MSQPINIPTTTKKPQGGTGAMGDVRPEDVPSPSKFSSLKELLTWQEKKEAEEKKQRLEARTHQVLREVEFSEGVGGLWPVDEDELPARRPSPNHNNTNPGARALDLLAAGASYAEPVAAVRASVKEEEKLKKKLEEEKKKETNPPSGTN